MIHWLSQDSAKERELAQGISPPGLLNDKEAAQFARLNHPKRRRDWLAGRWTAKRLLQGYLLKETGRQLRLDQIAIYNDAQRAPFGLWQTSGGWRALPVCLSVSHCDGWALCALVGRGMADIGADIERIEPRPPGFTRDYFTFEEINAVEQTIPGFQSLLVTAIWSAKEAALKALRLGLSVDTRSVSCEIGPLEQAPGDWASFPICLDDRRLNGCKSELQGWWQVREGFVLAIAARTFHRLN